MIPEAAVEAAARWLHDHDCRSALHSGFPADIECYDWLDEARELLGAAGPHIHRTAWNEGFTAARAMQEFRDSL